MTKGDSVDTADARRYLTAMENLVRTRGAVLLALLSLLAVGCQNEEDYRNSKVADEIAKIQAIEGAYRGSLLSQNDRQSLGNIVVELHPDTKIQASYDNLTSEKHATVQGALRYRGVTDANIVFHGGYYDDISRIFKATVPVAAHDGTTIELDIQGEIAGGVFTGTVEAAGYPEYGGSFELRREGGEADSMRAPVVTSSRAKDMRIDAHIYRGRARPSTSTGQSARDVTLSFTSENTNAAQVMGSLFVPTRSYDVLMSVFRPGEDHPEYSVLFRNATYDERNHQLVGVKGVPQGDQSFAASPRLDCTLQGAGEALNWGCEMTIGPFSQSFNAPAVAPQARMSVH